MYSVQPRNLIFSVLHLLTSISLSGHSFNLRLLC